MRHLSWLLLVASLLEAQSPPVADREAGVPLLRYEVTLGAEQALAREIEVVLRLSVGAREPVILSMAAWTPGSYHIANFARQLRGFSATQRGRPVRWDKLDPDSWRLLPEDRGEVEVRYSVLADSLDPARAWTREDFGFFNGTTLFLYPEGPVGLAATVRVRTTEGWLVVSAMRPTALPETFEARSLDDLMDHPFFVGRFDLDSAEVAGRWMRFASYPVGSVAGERRSKLWDAFRRAVPPLVAVFGELPWERYTVLQVADSGFGGMSALEHGSSELSVVAAELLDEPFVPLIHTHEFVHAWNVKRLRPVDLFPYRYDRPQPTTWLWMSEGITDYYADLATVRASLTDEVGFLNATLAKIDGVAERPATALEDASLQAWLGMTDGTADLYYDKGSLIGLALDILIRDASNNRRSLDEVMRELWEGPAAQRRGFTPDDWWNAVTRAAGGRGFGDFAKRYIDGREPLPWDDWLRRAGWQIVSDSTAEPRLGAQLRADPDGVRILALDPDGAAARAGLEVDDVLTHIGDRSTIDPSFGDYWRDTWGKRAGAAMPVSLRRGGTAITRTVIVELAILVDRHLAPDPRASEKAGRIRAGILRGSTGR